MTAGFLKYTVIFLFFPFHKNINLIIAFILFLNSHYSKHYTFWNIPLIGSLNIFRRYLLSIDQMNALFYSSKQIQLVLLYFPQIPCLKISILKGFFRQLFITKISFHHHIIFYPNLTHSILIRIPNTN